MSLLIRRTANVSHKLRIWDIMSVSRKNAGKNMTEKTTGIPELKNKKLLLVDDEPQLLSMLEQILYSDGFFQIYTAKTCKEALSVMEKQSVSLCILDVNLPDGDGFYLFREIRKFSQVPVIFLTARGEAEDKIRGLTLGADDYIVKPFLPKEFLLRVTALLRRTYGNILPENGFALPDSVYGERQILFDNAVVKCGSEELALTPKELILLKTLYSQKNRIVTSDALTMAAWGDVSYGYENTLMVHIRRLRQKIEENPSSPKHLLTVKGLGYKLVVKQ